MDRLDNYQERLVRFTRQIRSLPEAQAALWLARMLGEPGILNTFLICARSYVHEEDTATWDTLARLEVLNADAGARLLLEPAALKLLDLFKTVYFWEKAFPGSCRGISFEQRQASLAKIAGRCTAAPYRIALFAWGSFVEKASHQRAFSDVDIVLVLDSLAWLEGNALVTFLHDLFGSPHYNAPDTEEIASLARGNIARCGAITSAGLLSVKVLTRRTLEHCIDAFRVAAVPERAALKRYAVKNAHLETHFVRGEDLGLPVYPTPRDEVTLGPLAHFFDASVLLACNAPDLARALHTLRRRAAAKNSSILQAYQSRLSDDTFTDYAVARQHTPGSHMTRAHVARLKRAYCRARQENPAVGLCLRLHTACLGELRAGMWSNEELLRFFLGIHAARGRPVDHYYAGLDAVRESLAEGYLEGVLTRRAQLFVTIKQLPHTELVLLLTALADLAEMKVPRPLYYDLVEDSFKLLFPQQFREARAVLARSVDAGAFQRALEAGTGLPFRFRRRREAGLYLQSLTHGVPLADVDDICSFSTATYATLESARTRVRATLENLGIDATEKVYEIGSYHGIHTFFAWHGVPFEVYLMDRRSDISQENKSRRCVREKRQARAGKIGINGHLTRMNAAR